MLAYVRPMRREDIEQVAQIDREAFPTEWPPPNFRRELENRLAHYIVACDADKPRAKPEEGKPRREAPSGLLVRVKGWFDHRRFQDKQQAEDYILGFAGFWIMADEAHITTIASRKTHRRQGIGELLLISIIEMAIKLKARVVTLEVRVSNTAAQRLYTKYGFTEIGVRRGYYTDNREDGLLMSTEDIHSPQFQARFQKLKEAYSARWGYPPINQAA